MRRTAPSPLVQEQFSFEYVQLDRSGAVIQRLPGEARQVVELLAPGVVLEMVAVPGGTFQMGSRGEGGYPDELPIHPVFLKPFWLGKCPVTQAQWRAVMGKLPDCRFHGPDLPVETICWEDASAFCERLAAHTGRRYVMPSEAQWEYACRAGTRTPFSLGQTISTDFANYVGVHTYADEPPGVYRHGPLPAGTFPPNPWGLHDMHGTLWEFCADAWAPDYAGVPLDGSPRAASRPDRAPARRNTAGTRDIIMDQFGPAQADDDTHCRVARGGSWHETPAHCRSAMRLRVSETERMEYHGLRVVLEGEL